MAELLLTYPFLSLDFEPSATRAQTGTPTSKHGFVGKLGHETEDESGLEYMRARWYDAGVGRFVSEDSKQDGANWFEYARSAPTVKVDQTGHGVEFVLGVLFALAFVIGLELGEEAGYREAAGIKNWRLPIIGSVFGAIFGRNIAGGFAAWMGLAGSGGLLAAGGIAVLGAFALGFFIGWVIGVDNYHAPEPK